MTGTAHLESRCDRVARVLYSPGRDDMSLLRSARTLKRVHADLTLAAWDYSRQQGRTVESVRARAALDAIEQDLRSVLLGYASDREVDLHGHLVHALDQSLATIQLLAG